MITIFLTEPHPNSFLLLDAAGGKPDINRSIKITRYGTVVSHTRALPIVKLLIDQGFAVEMDTSELKGFIDHYMTREEISAAFGVSE